MTSHWGEIPHIPDTDSGIAAIEREQMTKLKAMEIEGPRLHQPSTRHYPPTNETLPADKFQIDPLTLHTIRLIQHARKLRSLINNIQLQLQQEKAIDYESSYPDAPLIPQYTGTLPINHIVHNPVPFMAKDMESDFVRGKGEPLPKIDDVSCRQILRRSVAAILAHVGYDTCADSVLETMTDITHNYLQTFSQHLRVAADNLAQHEPNGFPDIVEQVFHELGVGSVTCLHDFYHRRVVNYHQHMEQVCQQLNEEYEKLKEPMIQQKPPDTLSVIRIKEEPSEIHFPELDEMDEVNDAEQLLNLENLGGFEITVEHESASGLTTEVDSKWSQVKAEPGDTKVVSLENLDDSVTVKEPPQSSSSDDDNDDNNDEEGPSIADLMTSPTLPSKPKKMKKS